MFLPYPVPYTHHYVPVRIDWLKAVPYRFYQVKNYWRPTVGKRRWKKEEGKPYLLYPKEPTAFIN